MVWFYIGYPEGAGSCIDSGASEEGSEWSTGKMGTVGPADDTSLRLCYLQGHLRGSAGYRILGEGSGKASH